MDTTDCLVPNASPGPRCAWHDPTRIGKPPIHPFEDSLGRLIVFSGSGLSVPSGIPAFRVGSGAL